MPIYQNDKKIASIYHGNGVRAWWRMTEVYQGGELRYSWFYPKDTVFATTKGTQASFNCAYRFPYDFDNHKFINFDYQRIAKRSSFDLVCVSPYSTTELGTSTETETIGSTRWYYYRVRAITNSGLVAPNSTFAGALRGDVEYVTKHGYNEIRNGNSYGRPLGGIQFFSLNGTELTNITSSQLYIQQPKGTTDGLNYLLYLNGKREEIYIKEMKIIKNHL